MVKIIRRYCSTCRQKRPFERHGMSHGLHLLLTVVTLGLWLLVWIVLGVFSLLRPYRCRQCGKAAWL